VTSARDVTIKFPLTVSPTRLTRLATYHAPPTTRRESLRMTPLCTCRRSRVSDYSAEEEEKEDLRIDREVRGEGAHPIDL